MPAPEVFIQLGIGANACPSSNTLTLVSDAVRSLLPLGNAVKVVTVCGPEPGGTSSSIRIGLWTGVNGTAGDSQLRQDLNAWHLIGSRGEGAVALSISHQLLQYIVSTQWRDIAHQKVDLSVGFLRMDKTIRVETGSGRVTTHTGGAWKQRGARNIRFTFSIEEDLELRTIEPQIIIADDRIDIDVQNYIALFLIAAIAKMFSLFDFFILAVSNAVSDARSRGGAGKVLAEQWPQRILTPIAVPFLPGAINITWDDLDVGFHHIRTLGTAVPVRRQPMAKIIGPQLVQLKPPSLRASETYRVEFADLRRPVVRWFVDGSSAGTGDTLESNFRLFRAPSSGAKRIGVRVVDVDGLIARHELMVTYEARGTYSP